MSALKQVIDVLTRSSDRPVGRLIAYYVFVAIVVGTVVYFFPDVVQLIAGKGLHATTGGAEVLQDALSSSNALPGFGPGSIGELAVATLLILVGVLVLMLPVTWVYMSARSTPGHSQSVVQTLIILPLVVAGIIIVVQNSLALAFSLAGVVGAVRFRTTLRDTRDLVFIFLSIAVGFSAGVQSLAVGALVTIVFNFVLLLTWRYDYGRNALTPTASAQWAGPLEALANTGGDHDVPDRDLVLSLTPKEADLLADRFKRVHKTLGPAKKKPRYDAVLSLTTDNTSAAQPLVEQVLEHTTKRWKLDEVVSHVGKPSEMYFLVRLKKAVPSDDVITALHTHGDGTLLTTNIELGEPTRLKAEAKAG